MRVPRRFVLMLAAALLTGCKDLARQKVSSDDYLQSWFQQRVTPAEARHFFLQATERLMERLNSAASQTEKEQAESDMLRKEWASIDSHLQPLFAELRPEDELWIYRTYATVSGVVSADWLCFAPVTYLDASR